MISLVPLLLATASLTSDAPETGKGVSHVAVATVTIIQAEVITARPASTDTTQTDRQYRQRDSVPMVDFF